MAKGRVRDSRREVQWRRVVREQEQSGLSIREFCRRRGLPESAFHFWRRELNRRQAQQEQAQQSGAAGGPAFVEVRVGRQAVEQAGGLVVIELPGGRRVHVAPPVDRDAVREVLAALEWAESAAASQGGRPSSAEAMEGKPC